MKKFLLLFVVGFCFATTSFGQVSFGVGGTYVNDLGIQARANLNVSDDLGLIPSFSYYFTDIGTQISIDANLSYNVATIGNDIPIYALGGLDWTRFSNNGLSNSEIGINLGGGINIGNIYAEIFYRSLFGGDIGINVGYMF